MNSFIRIAEVWTPTADGASLELSSGLFPDAPAFEALTRQMIFARGEGLPGRAWEAGHPLMMRELSGTYFKRAAAAKAIDLTCAVALPVFSGTRLTCVIVLLMGGARSSIGSVELWHNDPRISSDLSLYEGYFGSSPKAAELEALTRDGWLPRGAGVPGLAWQKAETIWITDVNSSRQFLRKEEASALGIDRAMAMPCSTTGRDTWVFSLLSAAAAPISLRTEIWKGLNTSATGAGSLSTDQLVMMGGFSEAKGRLEAGSTHKIDALGPVGQAWCTAVAQAAPLTSSPSEPGITTVLAIPVMGDDQVQEIVALYF